MGVVHISEEEAIRDFAAVLAKVDAGEEVVIDRPGSAVRLERSVPRRTVAESIAILDALPGERGYMDEGFARDVRELRDLHRVQEL